MIYPRRFCGGNVMTNLNADILRSDQCARAFRRIFWGFPLHLVGPSIGIGRDHLHLCFVSWIGWLMVASGLSWIKELTPQIKRIRTLAYYLAFLSLIEVSSVVRVEGMIANLPVPPTSTPWTIVAVIYITARMIAEAILIWQLCGVIMGIASALDNADLGSKADRRRKLYVAFTLGVFLVGFPFILLFPLRWLSITVGLSVFLTLETAWIVVNGLIIGLMKRTEKVCRPVEV